MYACDSPRRSAISRGELTVPGLSWTSTTRARVAKSDVLVMTKLKSDNVYPIYQDLGCEWCHELVVIRRAVNDLSFAKD